MAGDRATFAPARDRLASLARTMSRWPAYPHASPMPPGPRATPRRTQAAGHGGGTSGERATRKALRRQRDFLSPFAIAGCHGWRGIA
jgi:hypothetical protein